MLAHGMPQLVVGQAERFGGLALVPAMGGEVMLEDEALSLEEVQAASL